MNENRVLVSVLCLTYNQVEYVGQMIESLLRQKTQFEYEIIINDDSSTDGTIEILKQYKKAHPNKIKLNLQKENQYSKGYRGFIPRYLIPMAKGKYIAICEGDDFWTDVKKLQLQVDFLNANKNYSLCFHPVNVIFEDANNTEYMYPKSKNRKNFTTKELIRGNYIQTNSVMYRKTIYESIKFDVFPSDWYLHLYHAQFGKIGFINIPMASYRRHDRGLWWDSINKQDTFWLEHGKGFFSLYDEMLNMYSENPEYKAIIFTHISNLITSLTFNGTDNFKKVLGELYRSAPRRVENILSQMSLGLTKKEKLYQAKVHENARLKYQLSQLAGELSEVHASRLWKAKTILARAERTLSKHEE